MYNRFRKPLLLSLCIGLMACQPNSGTQAPGLPPAPPTLEFTGPAELIAVENAQLLADDRFWPGADQLLVSTDAGRGLQLLDARGVLLSQLPGRFESLDHRASERGLLVALLDSERQQALLVDMATGSQRWGQPQYLPRTRFAIEGLCLYRDSAHNEFLFLIGEEGIGEQWLVAVDEQPLSPRRVRSLALPPESGYCQVDDASGQLFVNEENVGIWTYAADAEAALERQLVAVRTPFGSIEKATAGIALVPGGMLVLDPEAPALHLLQADADGWHNHAILPLDTLDEPEQISARLTDDGLQLLLIDDQGLHTARLDWQPPAPPVTAVIPTLPAQVQTDPVPSLGDAADDPAIWINPHDASQSRVLGTDKKGGLLAYDLAGNMLQDLRAGRLNNVDVRDGFDLGGELVDLAVASNRDHNSLHLFAIDRTSGDLRDIGQIATPLNEIYGLCLFKDAEGAIHAIPNDKDGTFLQYRLSAVSGEPQGELLRRFQVDSQPEGCVADDRTQQLFVGEEDVAVWVLDARADAPTRLTRVIGIGAVVHDDIEGLALYQGERHSYLVISSQGNDSYVVLDATAPYAVRGAFRIGLNGHAGIDGASETDGLEVTSANLGGIWRDGLLVVQDGRKRMPEGNQNYKYVPWSAVAKALQLP